MDWSWSSTKRQSNLGGQTSASKVPSRHPLIATCYCNYLTSADATVEVPCIPRYSFLQAHSYHLQRHAHTQRHSLIKYLILRARVDRHQFCVVFTVTNSCLVLCHGILQANERKNNMNKIHAPTHRPRTESRTAAQLEVSTSPSGASVRPSSQGSQCAL